MVSIMASAVATSNSRPAVPMPRCLGRELRQRAQHRARDAVGHQGLQEVLLQRPWKAG
jgi:hypothetical protein